MKAGEKIKRARIQLQKKKPFFAYLVLHLKVEESKDIPSMGVNILGDLKYNPKFVNKLTEEQVEGVLCHEVLHIGLKHLERLKSRDMKVWNIATDLVVNNLLTNNDMELPKQALIPNNNEFEFYVDRKKKRIKDLEKKSAERVYDELDKYASKMRKKFEKLMDKLEKEGRFDEHFYSDMSGEGKQKDSKGSKSMSKGDLKKAKESSKKWKRLMVEASTYAKQIGKLPAGLERFIGKLLEEKVNWKALLYKYISSEIPYDYSYSMPSKRSASVGCYMPSIKRENIEIVVAIDTSGSISQKDLTEFISEIVYLSRSFNNLKITIITCDADVQDVYTIDNGNINDVMDIKIHGGGGTSFNPPVRWCIENKPNTRLLIYFTDGYGDLSISSPFRIVWVLNSGDSTDESIKDKGDVIKIE